MIQCASSTTSNQSMEARIDKWLWAVRIFKTRTIAAEACKKGRITINGITSKPSKTVKEGDTIQVRKPPVIYSFKVIKAIENRVGAKLVPEMMENITPQEQYALLEMNSIGGFAQRAAGLGRPTKKDRRDMMDYISDSIEEEFDFDE